MTRARWGATHYLAVVGGVFLVWQAWTYGAWLRDGPRAVTEYRDTGAVSWYAARAYEAVGVTLLLVLGTIVVRRAIRERRLTFDVKLCIAGALTAWLDPFVNVVAPLFMYSSNWVNLNTVAGAMPGAINPDIGRLPWPFLFLMPVYTVGLLAFAMVMNASMRRVRQQRPRTTMAQLVVFAILAGALIDLAFEIPMFKMQLWAFPGTPDELAILGGDSTKFPFWELAPAAVLFGSIAALRFFKNDKGEAVTERGLERMSPRRRPYVSLLALVGLLNAAWFLGTVFQAAVGFYSDPYRPMPAHIVNGMCDAPISDGPDLADTTYGRCPVQGSRIPIRSVVPDPATSAEE